MRLALALILATAAPVLAEDDCKVEAGPNDVVKKKGDLTIESGQVVEDAIALDGTLTVKPGAKVRSAISFHGSVIIEPGAVVTKTALAIGGTVNAAKTSVVNNIVEISDKGLRVRGDSGDDLDLNLVINGKSLGQRIADEALVKLKTCKVVAKK